MYIGLPHYVWEVRFPRRVAIKCGAAAILAQFCGYSASNSIHEPAAGGCGFRTCMLTNGATEHEFPRCDLE